MLVRMLMLIVLHAGYATGWRACRMTCWLLNMLIVRHAGKHVGADCILCWLCDTLVGMLGDMLVSMLERHAGSVAC